MDVFKGFAWCILAFCLGVGLLAGCSMLPSLEHRSTSRALINTGTTHLGRAIAPLAEAHPGHSGVYPLSDAREAFAARVLLAQAAERTLDAQYYLWHKDLTGTLLFEALHAAADRGVRVRLLLDDNRTSQLDTTLAALDAHPNIEVRLFNPFVIRRPRLIGFITDFSRANRRMHNKSFTADSQATIIGGRNIGDEYFDASEGFVFVDLDVLAVGPVVKEVSSDFDRYWASGSSYPVDRLLPPADPTLILELAEAASLIERDPAAAVYIDALRHAPVVRDLLEGRLALEWATTRLVSDHPAKGLGLAVPEALIVPKLKAIIGDPMSEMDLVSAYFVPAAAGAEAFAALAARGVTVRVLTNALEATDLAPVHAGYAKRRKSLLEAGVSLYEVRRLSPNTRVNRRAGRVGSTGSSAAGLHAKTFAVDRARVFIGSFNFDPRSAKLNTEMGVVIESPVLAQRIAAAFETTIPANAYEVRLSETGELFWLERQDGTSVRHDTEPGTSFWQRAGVWFLSLLPIDWLL
jgi:putative cardiolipin synthase